MAERYELVKERAEKEGIWRNNLIIAVIMRSKVMLQALLQTDITQHTITAVKSGNGAKRPG